jgi:periplasmic protein TonB
MRVQAKAFQWSFLIHGLLIGTVFALGTLFKNPQQMLVINFDLVPSPAQIEETKPASKKDLIKPTVQPGKVSAKASLPSRGKSLPGSLETPPKEALSNPQSQVIPVPSEQAVPVFASPEKIQNTVESNPGLFGGGTSFSVGKVGGLGPPGSGGGGQGSGSGEEKAQSKYLRKHFSYIRDKILRNIHYPDRARRMGWEGKVLLSFIITLDGSIKEPKIIQSSGFEVLDKNAADTVKETAPFPKPPVEALLIIPITYRFN